MSEHLPDDRYRRRRAAGAESREATRRRLLVAADRVFRERGYAASPVTLIASEAGVSLQTLYLAWGSKRALLRAATDAAAVDAALPLEPEQWRERVLSELTRDAGQDPDAAAYFHAVARLFVDVATRTAPYWRMHRDGAAADPEIAAAWTDLTMQRRETMRLIASEASRYRLRQDLTADDVADTIWGLASPELYDTFTLHAGYDDDRFRSWLARSLIGALTDSTSKDD